MASEVEKAFKNAEALAMQKIIQKEEKAFANTMKRIERELFQIMYEVTVKNFYGGYFPSMYKRTGQLENAISIKLKDTSTINAFSFDVIPRYDESEMDHSVLTIIYQPKKNKKPFGKPKEYIYTLEDVDEAAIMELALGKGYHLNVGYGKTEHPIWLNDDDDTGVLFDSLENYIAKNASRIFNEEYNKLK